MGWIGKLRHAEIAGAAVGCAAAMVAGLVFWLSHMIGGDWQGIVVALAMLGFGIGTGAYYMARRRACAMDEATERLLNAAHGDLRSDISARVKQDLPTLALAMESLFGQTRSNIESVQAQAMHDPVTGLANRASYCKQVERLLAGPEMTGPAAIFFIDLDGFKAVNDTLGHAAGDVVLAKVAGRLRDVVAVQAMAGATDAVIGRFAGDEFTLFFPSLPPEMSAMSLAHAVQIALEEPLDISGSPVEIGASIGVAYFPEHGETLAALLHAADHAMYEAKNSGQRQVRLYNRELELRIAGRAALERELRRGLECDEFFLQFQPRFDAVQREIVGAEALVRWVRPDQQPMLPDRFIPIAEETGLMVMLGDWIVNRVCETVARCSALGVSYRFSVNISRRELAQPDFFNRLLTAMEYYRTPPDMIELELAESLMMKLRDETLEALVDLRSRGVCITLDNFGTGFSNLARLKDLPIDRVKVDRSMVRDIVVSDEARTICSAIVGLVRGLGLEIAVEGVENEEQVALLRIMGCSVLQGFHLSHPLNEDEYLARFTASGGRKGVESA